MRNTLLGRTGLHVSSIALGTMTFGTRWGFGAGEADSRRMFDLYADRGGNFIDTADKYTDGDSETMVGAFTKGRRERFVIASKYSVPTDAGDLNSAGNGRKNLVQSLEGSLKRLGTDYIDLYWVHVYDGVTPIEESIRALDDMVRAGKILHIGYSDHPAWEIARADALAEKSGWTRPAAIQLEYNLAQREGERELLPMAERLGLGVVCWGPLAGGALTGKYLGGEAEGRVSGEAAGHYARYRDEHTATVAQAVVDAAKELGCSPAQLAIAWLIRQSPRFVPLIGARTADQLGDTLDAADLVIPDEIEDRLEEVGRIDLGFPYGFLRQDWGRWWSDLYADLDPRVKRRIVAAR